jgi:hypothetical protein
MQKWQWRGVIALWTTSALVSVLLYVGVCLWTGQREAWDASWGQYYLPLAALAALLGFMNARASLVTGFVFGFSQAVGSLVWSAMTDPVSLASWPVALVLTVPFFVLPVVLPAALLGAGVRILGERIL